MKNSTSMIVLITAGCRGTIEPLEPTVGCTVTQSETPISLNEVSSLGFSAEDVLSAVGGNVNVLAVDDEDGSIAEHEIVYTFGPDDTAQVVDLSGPEGEEICVVGASLTVTGTLNITSTDGWFLGSGPFTISAQGVDQEEIWLTASFVIKPSPELQTIVEARNAFYFSECDAADVVLSYPAVDQLLRPWSDDHGSLGFTTCVGAATLYQLSPK